MEHTDDVVLSILATREGIGSIRKRRPTLLEERTITQATTKHSDNIIEYLPKVGGSGRTDPPFQLPYNSTPSGIQNRLQ